MNAYDLMIGFLIYIMITGSFGDKREVVLVLEEPAAFLAAGGQRDGVEASVKIMESKSFEIVAGQRRSGDFKVL